jgi:hypothetical protein
MKNLVSGEDVRSGETQPVSDNKASLSPTLTLSLGAEAIRWQWERDDQSGCRHGFFVAHL